MATRILIVDDHPAVREGLAVRISSQADLEVCGEAADVGDALKVLAATQPDVAVVDIQLKTGDGLDLVKRIKARDESVRVLVWSVYPDKLYAERALNAGALGYINKEHTTGRIVDAIRCVAGGKVYLCEEMAQSLLSQAIGGTRDLQRVPDRVPFRPRTGGLPPDRPRGCHRPTRRAPAPEPAHHRHPPAADQGEAQSGKCRRTDPSCDPLGD